VKTRRASRNAPVTGIPEKPAPITWVAEQSNGIDFDLAKAAHRLPPQFVEPGGEALGELAITHEERCETTVLHEWMVQRHDHGIVLDDVEGMAQFAGIADARHVTKIDAVALEKAYERPRGLI
jgi:hypothetical protein